MFDQLPPERGHHATEPNYISGAYLSKLMFDQEATREVYYKFNISLVRLLFNLNRDTGHGTWNG
jgi:hypothetical protein